MRIHCDSFSLGSLLPPARLHIQPQQDSQVVGQAALLLSALWGLLCPPESKPISLRPQMDDLHLLTSLALRGLATLLPQGL